MKIIFIDDSPSILRLLAKILSPKKNEWDMVFESDPQKALELIFNDSFDLVVTDLVMPDIDGIEVLKQVKKNYLMTEVIILTSEGTVQNAIEAMRLGACDYMTKPVQAQIMIPKLEHLERMFSGRNEAEEFRQKKEYIEGVLSRDVQSNELELKNKRILLKKITQIIGQEIDDDDKVIQIEQLF